MNGFVKTVNNKNMKNIWIIILISNLSCSNTKDRTGETPNQFKTKEQANLSQYKIDSLKMFNDFTKMMKNHEGEFYSYKPENVDTTKSIIHIDTIVFSPNRNKAFVLLSTEFLLKKYTKVIDEKLTNLGSKKLFDGHGFFCKMKGGKWFYEHYYVEVGNYENLQECLDRLREIYFHEISLMNRNNYNRFNIDDVRMWEEPVWKKF